MNIAFDAKRAYTNSTGLGHYSRTLITSLAECYPEHDYFLCTPKLTNRFHTKNMQNVHVITPQHFPSTVFTPAWRSSWIKKELKKLNIELYHGLSHEIPVGTKSTGIRTVVTIHDLIFERFPKQYNPVDVQIYRRKFRYACKSVNQIIAISKQTKQDIVAFYKIPERKIAVCYQSCNPRFGIEVSTEEKLRIKQQYHLPDQFFLYVGSIIERKNLLTICKALHELKNKINIPLVVIGDGRKYKRKVEEFITSNSLQHDIMFLSEEPTINAFPGYQSAADFPAIYQQALCMIYPSIFEGFGIPVLEALWSKLPVITSNVSSLPEAGGEGALYIDPMNKEQLAETMYKVATDSSVRHDLATKGWKHAQNFTVEKTAACVMDVYKKAIL